MESLLGDLPVRGEDLQENAAGVCTGTGDTSESDTPGGCSAVAAELEDDDDEEGTALAKAFLRRSHPLLDRWMQWLLITQRPGAKGWGGQAKRVPLGAFQVDDIDECSHRNVENMLGEASYKHQLPRSLTKCVHLGGDTYKIEDGARERFVTGARTIQTMSTTESELEAWDEHKITNNTETGAALCSNLSCTVDMVRCTN